MKPWLVWPLPYPGEPDAHFARRIAGRYRDCPEAYHLWRITWKIMGTLTFRWRVSARRPEEMFRAMLRRACKRHDVYFPNLMWFVRAETGTRTDLNPHLHFLIAGLRRSVDLRAFCRDCEAEWHRLGGGMRRIEPYSRPLEGAGYVAKQVAQDSGDSVDPCNLAFSHAAQAFLQRVARGDGGL